MNRLIENTVFSGFVIACRLATCPTRISPSFVNPATEGVSRLPSWFAITVGLPPSTTATTELVVPRSMPITFAMSNPPSPWSFYGDGAGRSAPSRHSRQLDRLDDVDLDRLGLYLFHLRELHLEHPIAVRRFHLVGLHGHRQLHAAFELPVHALDVIHALVLDVSVGRALPLQDQQIPRDRQGHILVGDAWKLEVQNELILGLVNIQNRRPGAWYRGRGSPQEAVEEAVHLSLHIGHVPERIPPLDGHERTPTLNRHFKALLWLSAGPLLGSRNILSTQVIYHLSYRLS